MTCDMGHVTHDMWHIVVGERSLKISTPKLFWFVLDSVLKILNYRTALATPSLLKRRRRRRGGQKSKKIDERTLQLIAEPA